MADIAKMLKTRRGGKHPEDFAHDLGIRVSTYYRYETGKRNMSVPNLRQVGRWAKRQGDVELLNALVEYALGVNLADTGHPGNRKAASN